MLKFGLTALHSAALSGFEQIVKILVEHGSNIHIQNEVFVFFFFDFDFYFFVFSCFFICCCGFIVGLFHVDCEWLGCVIFILFYSFSNNFLFVKVWNDRSSLCC